MSVVYILGELVEILDTGNVKLIPPSEDVNMEKKIKTIYPTPNSTLRVKLSSEEVNTSASKDLQLRNEDAGREAGVLEANNKWKGPPTSQQQQHPQPPQGPPDALNCWVVELLVEV